VSASFVLRSFLTMEKILQRFRVQEMVNFEQEGSKVSIDERHYVASFVDGSSRFIGSGGLKLYEFIADVADYSKIAVISHGRLLH
jgi:hypothetical protein